MDVSIENLENFNRRYKEFLNSPSKTDDHIEHGRQLLLEVRLQGRYLTDPDEREQASQMARDISERLFELTDEYLPSRLEPLNVVDSDFQDVFSPDNDPKFAFVSKSQLVIIGLIFAILIVLILIFAGLGRGFSELIAALNSTATSTATLTTTITPTSNPPTTEITLTATTGTPTPICQSDRFPLGGPPVDVEVEIKSPKDCVTVLEASITVSGTYSGDLTDKEIWILVYTSDRIYYPQSLDCLEAIPSKASEGNWETKVFFGDPGKSYDVVATVLDTDGQASQEFKMWLREGCEKDKFSGYPVEELPPGITEMDAITVSRASE